MAWTFYNYTLNEIERKFLSVSLAGTLNDHRISEEIENIYDRFVKLRDDLKTLPDITILVFEHYLNLATDYQEFFTECELDLKTQKYFSEKAFYWYEKIPKHLVSEHFKDLYGKLEEINKIVTGIYDSKKVDILRFKEIIEPNLLQTTNFLKVCIMLGELDDAEKILSNYKATNSEISLEHFRYKNRNMQLLRIILLLEERITFDINLRDDLKLSKEFRLLGQGYFLADVVEISKLYTKLSNSHLTKFFDENEEINHEEELEKFIQTKIETEECDLPAIEAAIEEKFNRTSLTNVDRYFIGHTFMEHVTSLWLVKCDEYFTEIANQGNDTVVKEMTGPISELRSLDDMPVGIKTLKYSKLLLGNKIHLSAVEEKQIIKTFKTKFFHFLQQYSASIKFELDFFTKFFDFLNTVRNLREVIEKFQLNEIFEDRIGLDSFFKNLKTVEVDSEYSEKLQKIKSSINFLQELDKFFFQDEFKQMIKKFLDSVQIKSERLDSRNTIEVIGQNFGISEILPLLIEKRNVKDANIEELRFISPGIIHLDANLENEFWHGVNIIVYANKVKAYPINGDKVTWDISGEPNSSVYSEDAKTDSSGNGLNGNDGYPGESGGNVFWNCEEFENLDDFILLSNGGNGSNGQNGGDGRNGTDGEGLNISTFLNDFPCTEDKFFLARKEMNQGLENLFGLGDEKIDDYSRYDTKTFYSGNQKFGKVKTRSNQILSLSYYERYYYYVFYSKGMADGYFLGQGTIGESGGSGGFYGFGGQGGFDGEIVRNVLTESNIISKPGEDGKNGIGGLYGKHGKNGWDVGYMRYTGTNGDGLWKEVLGTDANTKLRISESSDLQIDYVYNPYWDKYIRLLSSRIEHPNIQQQSQRNEFSQNRERQRHSLAVKKNSISQLSITTKYSSVVNSNTFAVLNHMREITENLENKSKAFLSNQDEDDDELSTELSIRKEANFDVDEISKNWYLTKTINVDAPLMIPETDPNILIQNLEQDPTNVAIMLDILKRPLQCSSIETVLKIFTEHRNEIQASDEIARKLIDKYRFCVANQIANRKPEINHKEEIITDDQNAMIKYLIKVDRTLNKIGDTSFGFLRDYMFNDIQRMREIVINYCKNIRKENQEVYLVNNEIKKLVLMLASIKPKDNEIDMYSNCRIYFEESEKFFASNEQKLSEALKKFHDELQDEDRELIYLGMRSLTHSDVQEKFEEKINLKFSLKNRYNQALTLKNTKYDWEKCYKDSEVFNEFLHHLELYGCQSPIYLAFLSQMFDTKIQVYEENGSDQYSLINTYNSGGRQTTHILLNHIKDNFEQLEINTELRGLTEHRQKSNILFGNIISNLEMLLDAEGLQSYLNGETFLSIDQSSIYYRSNYKRVNLSDVDLHFQRPFDQIECRKRIEILSNDFIENQCVVYDIMNRFDIEGRQISAKDFLYLVDVCLECAIDDRNDFNRLNWIVIAFPQTRWTDELILLAIENHYGKSVNTHIEKWRNFLLKVRNKDLLLLIIVKLVQLGRNDLPMEELENILYLLSFIQTNIVDLEELSITEWPYVLKESYWQTKILKVSNLKDLEEKSSMACHYILKMENNFGFELVERFVNILIEINPSAVQCEELLQHFCFDEWRLEPIVFESLEKSKTTAIDLESLRELFLFSDNERTIEELVRLMKNADNQYLTPTFEKIIKNVNQMIRNDYCSTLDGIDMKIREFTVQNDDFKKWRTAFDSAMKKHASNKEEFLLNMMEEIFAVIDHAINCIEGFYLWHSVKLTVYLLLYSTDGVLAQVGTGEGKTLIIVAAAIIKVLSGKKVDVITSSPVLAKRDAIGHNKMIYNLFGINVADNCSEDIEKRKIVYSNNDVVYGDLANFQRDYLLHNFYKMNVLGTRKQENVFIDEVDSMLLDKGNNVLYLSHDLVGLDQLESIYIYIWQCVNRPSVNAEDFAENINIETIKRAVLFDLYGVILKEDIKSISKDLNLQQLNIIWLILYELEIIDDRGRLLKPYNYVDKLRDKIQKNQLGSYKDRIEFLVSETIDRSRLISVPNYLLPFIEDNLDDWIRSAIWASMMKEDQNYVVDVDRTATSMKIHPNITIIDNDTGTDLSTSQWDNALHQFLQLKHGCRLSMQSLKAVFLSNVRYFQYYDRIYGMSGTLGTSQERKLLQQIHNVQLISIPTFKTKRFREVEPIVCSTQEKWIESIVMESQNVAKSRAVLIICETIEVVEMIYGAFGGKTDLKVHSYTRDYVEFDVAQGIRKLMVGEIIIATNLAGRGTDIKLEKDIQNAGGLHVIITNLPKNYRIEQQAFGRAARSGKIGTGQLIILNKEIKSERYQKSMVLAMKRNRDIDECHRIAKVREEYYEKILPEERNFGKFMEIYQEIIAKLGGCHVSKSIEKLLQNTCLDRWAFWLEKSKNLDGPQKNKSLQDFLTELNALKCSGALDYIEWTEYNKVQTLNLGILIMESDSQEAMRLFDHIINAEPKFSDPAKYFKSYLLTIEGGRSLEYIKSQLMKSRQSFQESLRREMTFKALVDEMQQKTVRDLVQVDGYSSQKQNICEMYNLYVNAIEDILGYPIYPQRFSSGVINGEMSIILFHDLLDAKILKRPKIHGEINFQTIQNLEKAYGLPSEGLKSFIERNTDTDIFEQDFLADLNESLNFGSREKFWEFLVEKNILQSEIELIAVDVEKLKEFDPEIINGLAQYDLDTVIENRLFLYPEFIEKKPQNVEIYLKNSLKSKIDEIKWKFFLKVGIFSLNNVASFNIENAKNMDIYFPWFDSISVNDLCNDGISLADAIKLIDILKEKAIIKSVDGTYRLILNYDEIANIQTDEMPIYNHPIQSLLSISFLFRRTLQHLIDEVIENEIGYYIMIPLLQNPHMQLFAELVEANIISPVYVDTTLGNYGHHIRAFYESNALKLPYRSKLFEEASIHSTVKILDSSFGILERKKGKEFVWKLNPIDDYLKGQEGKNEEKHLFKSHGLGQLISVEEKRWSKKMLVNTFWVLLMGILQIIVGAVIEVFSAGSMTFVAGVWIGEGISDIFFASYCLSTGYFSWKDYLIHKVESLILSACTFGVGVFLARGVKLARYGYKIAAPTLKFGGKKIAEMSGKRLLQVLRNAPIKNIGPNIAKQVIKRIATKTIQGITFGLASIGIDQFVENVVQDALENISSSISQRMKSRVEEHPVNETLLKVFRIGKDRAYEIVGNATEIYLAQTAIEEIVTSFTSRVFLAISGGIFDAAEKIQLSRGEGNAILYAKLISLGIKSIKTLLEIEKINQTVDNILDKLNEHLESQIKTYTLSEISEDQVAELERDPDFMLFKTTTTEDWVKLLNTRVNEIIRQNIINPILQDSTRLLIHAVGLGIRKGFRNIKDRSYGRKFEKLKNQYYEDQKSIKHIPKKFESLVKNKLRENYHRKLLVLMAKTSNPKLFASIIRENVPMDITCVNACVYVVPKILKEQGFEINGLTIVVKGEHELSQTFSSVPKDQSGLKITLQLKDNHFLLTNDRDNQQSKNSGINNCLFDALSEQLKLNMNGQSFRLRLAKFIESDPEIRSLIQKNYHQFAMSYNMFGGGKGNRTQVIPRKITDEAKEVWNWQFYGSKDNDLRNVNIQGEHKLRDVNQQRQQAFRTTLYKINKRISSLQRGKSPNSQIVKFDRFSISRYDQIVYRDTNGEQRLGLYPVEINAKANVKLSNNTSIDFSVTLDVDNLKVNENAQGPREHPNRYEVITKKTNEGLLPSDFPAKLSGDILINPEDNEYVLGREISHASGGVTRYDKDITIFGVDELFTDEGYFRGRRFPFRANRQTI